MTKAKRICRKLHNSILKASAMAASLTFIVAGSMLDNHSWTPTIICAGSLLYLAAFAYANLRKGE